MLSFCDFLVGGLLRGAGKGGFFFCLGARGGFTWMYVGGLVASSPFGRRRLLF